MASPLDSIGLSFSPTGAGPGQSQQNTPDGPLSPVQQAIKILSLRVPQHAGPGGITPSALLTSPGGMASGGGPGGGMDLMALLRQLLQGGGGQPGAGGMAGGLPGGIPLPHITPGGEPTTMPGPGMPTMPPTGGGPTVDRTTPAPSAPSPMGPPLGLPRGPLVRSM